MPPAGVAQGEVRFPGSRSLACVPCAFLPGSVQLAAHFLLVHLDFLTDEVAI